MGKVKQVVLAITSYVDFAAFMLTMALANKVVLQPHNKPSFLKALESGFKYAGAQYTGVTYNGKPLAEVDASPHFNGYNYPKHGWKAVDDTRLKELVTLWLTYRMADMRDGSNSHVFTNHIVPLCARLKTTPEALIAPPKGKSKGKARRVA